MIDFLVRRVTRRCFDFEGKCGQARFAHGNHDTIPRYLDPRLGAHLREQFGRRRLPPFAGPCPTRRALGLQAVLAGRAPQYPRHRQRGDRRCDRPHRRRDLAHPCRRRWHHAAEPRAAGDRRTVRHARGALPRPDRPWPGPCPWRRPENRRRPAPQPRKQRRHLPTGPPGASVILPPRLNGSGREGGPRRRRGRADLAAGIK